MSENRLNTRELAEISILVALAIVLNQIKVWQVPQGGSVTLASMIPVMLLAYRRGVKVGIIGGSVFGLVQMVIEGYVYYPIQIILDYPLAFACLGLAGFFKKLPPGWCRCSTDWKVPMSPSFRCRILRGVCSIGSESMAV